MKRRKVVQAPLLASIVVVVIALWCGAAPSGGSNADAVGGTWVSNWLAGPYWRYVAADQWGSCIYCYGTFSDSCTNYVGLGGCYGGYVTAALCASDSSAGGTTHPGGSVPCWDSGYSDCDDAHDAWCY